ARGRLARSRLQHLAHDHVLDLVGLEPRALERGADDDRPELGRRLVGERAAELAERRADGGDDDGAGHEASVAKASSRPAKATRRRTAASTSSSDASSFGVWT